MASLLEAVRMSLQLGKSPAYLRKRMEKRDAKAKRRLTPRDLVMKRKRARQQTSRHRMINFAAAKS